MFYDFLANTLHFADRQIWALQQAFEFIGKLASGGLDFKQFTATVMIIFNLFNFVITGAPIKPYGKELDLDGYTLVMCDEFEGDELDTSTWYYRIEGERRSGLHSSDQVEVKDGNLIITAEYLTDGKYGEGWYSSAISLKEKYCRGYFEIRCKCNPGAGFWSAFWIQGKAPYDHILSNGGIGPGGAEIDIFEATSGDEPLKKYRDGVVQTIWCNGFDDDPDNIDGCRLGTFSGNNIYDEYNTYGLMWDEEKYTFYINGVETRSCSFGKGTSTIPEDVIVSLEIPDEIPEGLSKDHKTQYIVDYVKIYQKCP